MKKSLFFLGLVFCLQQADAQFPIIRHFWLNDSSYNHTLHPTSDGGYIIAAARQQLGAKWRNTIAVLKLDAAYNIQHPQIQNTDAQIIGISFGGEWFDMSVNFEVHDIVENVATKNYVICGSINYSGGTNVGMVTIIDQNLSVQSIREYPDVDTFYSVYAEGKYFYVCGNTHKKEGIVLRDEMFTMNPTAHITKAPWTYYKIKVNNNSNDIVVSGSDAIDIGFTAFDITGGNFVNGAIASQRLLQPYSLPNPKVVLTNYPGNPQGLILSMSGGNKILTFFFTNYNQVSSGNLAIIGGIQDITHLFLEDVEVDINSNPNLIKMAWVGNHWKTNLPNLTAFYISWDVPIPILPQMHSFIPYIHYPLPPSSAYFRLHKVHFTSGDFHCGGFYNHHNNNKSTFVVAPEQAVHQNCGLILPVDIEYYGTPWLNILPITPMNVKVQPNKWLERKYNFCDTDCDDAPLNDNTSNPKCGNQ